MTAPTEAADLFAFDNSYARLPERFFARLPPTPVAAPRLVRLNEKLARQLGLDPARLSSPEGVAILAGNRGARAGRTAGHGLCRAPVRPFRAAARRRPRHPARRGRRSPMACAATSSSRAPAPRPSPAAATAAPRSGPVLREYIISEAMARARHPDDALARRGHDRRDGPARNAPARRRADPRRVEPHPGRHLPVLRRARRCGGGPAARRLRHRPALPRGRWRREPVPRAARSRDRAPGRACRADGCSSASFTAS